MILPQLLVQFLKEQEIRTSENQEIEGKGGKSGGGRNKWGIKDLVITEDNTKRQGRIDPASCSMER